MSDTESGGMYAMWGLLITAWGFVASYLVDSYGVRYTTIFSTLMSVVSRGVLVFSRSRHGLMLAVFVLCPAADGTFGPCFSVGK